MRQIALLLVLFAYSPVLARVELPEVLTVQERLLHETIAEWRGELEQLDDVCIIGMRV
jgi:hypothetical protein